MASMASPWKHPDSGIYYHRVGVPKDIREQIGKAIIKFSLKTRDYTQAKRLFLPRYEETLALFQQARDHVTLTPKDIEVLAERWMQAAIVDMEEAGTFDDYLIKYSDRSEDCSSFIRDALQEDCYTTQIHMVRDHVASVLKDNNVLLTEGSTEYRELTRHICFRLMELSKIAYDRFSGDWLTVPNTNRNLINHRLSTEEVTLSYKPISKIVEDFTKYKTSRGEWKGKTLLDPVGVYGQFIQYVGEDIDPSSITRDQLRDFIALLFQLPQRYSITTGLKDMSFEQLVDIAATRDLPLLSATTVKKKFVFIKSLFKHAVQEEWIVKDRTAGINVPKGELKQRVQYLPDELQTIFNATKDAERPSDYWCPRIALATGMRSNEILQLTKDSVQQANGVWFLSIDTEIDKETGVKKKAKTANSQRKVPIPSVLIDIGLLDYVSGIKEGRLFPCVQLAKADGTYSFTYSKRFNPLLKQLGLKPDHDEMVLRDFHSFRHTFRSNARAYGISKELAELIGGWKSQTGRTAGDNYGLHYDSFILEMKTNIDKIDYGTLFD